MKQSQRIVKNAVFGISASFIGSFILLAMVSTIAHSVTVVEFGKYSFVLAFAIFFQLVADSGLPRIVIREIARNPDGFVPLVGAATSLIWILSAAIILVVGLIIPFLHFGMDVKIAALLMSFATMAMFHGAGYGAVLRAFEDFELIYLANVLHKVLLFGFVLLALKFHLGVLGFAAAYLAANVLLWNCFRLMVTKLYAHVPLRVDVPLWKSLMVSALPMGGGVILRQLALQLDILILTWLTNLTTVGLFSGPYRISMALRVVPETLSLPLFPLFSRTADLSPVAFTEAYQKSLKFFAIISFPIAAFFMAWSEPILRLVLGAKFLPAIPAMQLLGIGMVPFFLSTLFQYLFAALDQQGRFLWATCAGSALRIILLIILVPKYGFIGPSIAFVCSEVVIVAISTTQLARLGFHAKLGNTIWRPLVAGSAMALVLFAGVKAPLLWQIGAAAVSVIVYGVVLFAFKTFTTEEIDHAREGIAFVPPFIESWSKKLKRGV